MARLPKCRYSKCGKSFKRLQPLQVVCSPSCAYKYQKEKRENDLKKLHKIIETKDYIDYGAKLQDKVNLIVRLIDKGLKCLARKRGGQMHAGHVYARGGNATIRYNLHNIHRQNAQSNHHQNDDGLLREGLANEYGYNYMEFISALRQTKALDLNNMEFKALTRKASKIASELKKEDKRYNLKERIELRNKINVKLGIYESKYCNFKI